MYVPLCNYVLDVLRCCTCEKSSYYCTEDRADLCESKLH